MPLAQGSPQGPVLPPVQGSTLGLALPSAAAALPPGQGSVPGPALPPGQGSASDVAVGLRANALQALGRQVVGLRVGVIGLAAPPALVRTGPGAPTYLACGAVLLVFALSCALFRGWERFGPLLTRHRPLLAVDLGLCGLLLVPPTPGSPLAFVSVCTPLLAGLLHGRPTAALYAAGQAAVVALAAGGPLPVALCVLAGAAGTCLRDLLTRFAAAGGVLTETRARLAAAGAVRAERERLAREMHDSVAKTLHGLALAADALARTTDPAAVRRRAESVARGARRAAAESRELLTDLRRHPEAPAVRLPEQLRRIAAGAELRITGTLPVVPAAVAHHLLAVASEALENARRHAAASYIGIEAAAGPAHLTLTVEDDGRGLPPGGPAATSPGSAGHYGLPGMAERAAAIGARLHIGPRPTGPGTRVRLSVPLAALTAPAGEGGP
ncbi:sensor histidine kinase [Streptomyces sp. NPDC091268]|uniref:sensor histidine kinase n=1 Tax=Streptomyces sp. NPDC091268 TaxID=3365979 RepID=UPI0038028C94